MVPFESLVSYSHQWRSQYGATAPPVHPRTTYVGQIRAELVRFFSREGGGNKANRKFAL